jgi:hypothetical protein
MYSTIHVQLLFSSLLNKIDSDMYVFDESTGLKLGLATEFRSEKNPRNRFGMDSVILRKKVLIPRHSEVRGRVNPEALNGNTQ